MEIKTLLVTVNGHYIDYLRQYDMSILIKNSVLNDKPEVGILIKINSLEYFIPLITNISREEDEDIYLIKNGKLGYLSFSSMIPITPASYTIFDFHNALKAKEIKEYHKEFYEQLMEININIDEIIKKATKFYDDYKTKKLDKNILARCVNFNVLESNYLNYMK